MGLRVDRSFNSRRLNINLATGVHHGPWLWPWPESSGFGEAAGEAAVVFEAAVEPLYSSSGEFGPGL